MGLCHIRWRVGKKLKWYLFEKQPKEVLHRMHLLPTFVDAQQVAALENVAATNRGSVAVATAMVADHA